MRKKVVHGFWLPALTGLVLGMSGLSVSAQYPNGIYAEFNTSMGSFTNRLEYTFAPKATANFIGLATGERAWLDMPSGTARTNPFFNGTTFHRVIAGFMNQGGSPNGQGTDGPGYSFVDEFVPSLRHDTFGTLSCANSGPDSNGSQFFVTAGATPWLNDLHTVFGKLHGGSNVVYAINHVATGAADKPLTNIVIHSVTIRRIGTAAQAFNIHTQGLPVLTNLNVTIAKFGTNVNLSFSNRLNAENWLSSSTNLATWTGNSIGLETSSLSANGITRPAIRSREFFRMAQVQYPPPLYVPRSVTNKTLTLVYDGGNGTIVYNFNAVGTGTYTWTGNPSGTILGYSWQQDPYRGRFLPIGLSGIVPMNLHLDFDSAAVGTFKGTAFPNYPSSLNSFPVSGTFTNSP